MNNRFFALPFIEDRNRALSVAAFISFLLHGLVLGPFSLTHSLLTAQKPEDSGISIDLAMVETSYPKSDPALPTIPEAEAPKAEPLQQEISKPEPEREEAPEPAPKPEQTPVKKPKRDVKKVAHKLPIDSKRREAESTTAQKNSQSPGSDISPKAAAGETTPPVPAGGSSNPIPPYPDLARKRGQEGTVNIRCLVDSAGNVTEAGIGKSSGFRLLDDAALETVRKWKFKPGKKDGITTTGTVIVPVQFKLR